MSENESNKVITVVLVARSVKGEGEGALEGFTPQPATPLSRPLYYNSSNSRFDIRTPSTKL